MLEKSPLADEKIIQALHQAYGLDVARLEFLPLGNDANGWVYRVDLKDGVRRFLKVKQAGTTHLASVSIPHFLKDRGLEQVVAALPTPSGALWHGLESFELLVYPFIQGASGMELGLTDAQWVEYGAFLKSLHTARLPADLQGQLTRESFRPPWSASVRKIQALVEAGKFATPQAEELAGFWRDHSDEIQQIVARAASLGLELQQTPRDFVLCHADIHTANILIDAAGALFVVDWDGVLLAPKERDLLFVIGDDKENLFLAGYGPVEIDWLALAYYRYEWVVQEIGDYGERVFGAEAGAETRVDAVRGFRQLFAPGDVVAGAFATEKLLGKQP